MDATAPDILDRNTEEMLRENGKVIPGNMNGAAQVRYG
jgi:hypothetical protein